jgi:16S rRNA G1207 methylase RsmC
LATAPGVFSAEALDRGSELLLGHVCELPAPKICIDLGCGAGPLGLLVACRFPQCRVVLADADARAVAVATQNAQALGVTERCAVHWWDVDEPLPAAGCDLGVMNPPFHTGMGLDRSLTRSMLLRFCQALASGGQGLVVVNRSVPAERVLREYGDVRELSRPAGTTAQPRDSSYKVLRLSRWRA